METYYSKHREERIAYQRAYRARKSAEANVIKAIKKARKEEWIRNNS